MSEWIEKPIVDLIERHWSGEWGAEPTDGTSSARVYRSTEIDDAGHLRSDEGVFRSIARSQDHKMVRSGDILVEVSGGAPNRPVGRVAFAQFDTDERRFTSNFVRTLRPKKGIDGKYLNWRLHWLNKQPQILRFQQQTTGIINLQVDDYLNHKIHLPVDESEQKLIATVLDLIDAKIEATEALIAKQVRVRTGLMQDLFTRGVDEHGQLRPPRDQAPHLYHQTELGWLPLGWEGMTLASACSIIRDGTHLPPPRTDTGPLLLSVRNMIDGGFQLTESDERVPESFFEIMHRNWRIRPGDTLLAIVGATIGKTCQVPDSFPKFTLQRSVCILRGEETVLEPAVLALLVQRPEFKVALWSRANQTAQPGIYLDQIARISVPVPLKREQGVVYAAMRSVSNGINVLKNDLTKLRLQKTGLMQDLLTGKVSVAPLLESAGA